MYTAPRGTASTFGRSPTCMRTSTVVFGSRSSRSLVTEQSNSPTLRVPRFTTCFGSTSVFPVHTRSGCASHKISTGWSDRDLPQFRLVDERADAHVMQIGHLGQRVARLHEISRANRQRIQRAVHRRGAMRRGRFRFQILHLRARVLHQQRHAPLIELRLLLRGLLHFFQRLHVGFGLRQLPLDSVPIPRASPPSPPPVLSAHRCRGAIGRGDAFAFSRSAAALANWPACPPALATRKRFFLGRQIGARLRQLRAHFRIVQ